MTGRIRQILIDLGLEDAPSDPQESLVDAGLDSLLLVRLVMRLEKAFAVKIPARGFDRNDFATLASVEALLRRLGAS